MLRRAPKDAFILSDPVLPPEQQVPEPVSLQLDAETSWNAEIGARTRIARNVGLEVTAFLLDFSNQIITPSASAGTVAQAALANQGQYTFVDARFSRDRFIATGGDTVNVNGNELPYAPRHRLAIGVSLNDVRGIDVRLDGTLVSEQFADNFETRAASPNGRNGVIAGYELWNLSASYRVTPGATAVVAVKNLLDARYIASRRPEGIKPGLPRLMQLGIELDR